MAGIKRHPAACVWTVQDEEKLFREERQLKKIDDALSKLDNSIEEKWEAKILVNERRYETLTKICNCVLSRRAALPVVAYWIKTLERQQDYLMRIKKNSDPETADYPTVIRLK